MISRLSVLAVVAAALASLPADADGTGVVGNWRQVQIPEPPALTAAEPAAHETALLMLDFNSKICNQAKRPSCAASLPAVAKLLAAARKAGVAVIHTTGGSGGVEDIPAEVAPLQGEPVVRSGVDKFYGTNLDQLLKDRNIRTVIAVGTSAHGAVLYTASEAALRDYDVLVPVDTISADTPFAELATAWILTNAPASVSAKVKLSATSMIRFPDHP